MNLLEIKYERLSEHEQFLFDIFNGLVKYMSVQYTDRFIYKKDNKVMFEYDPNNQTLWYSFLYIWIVFRDVFELDYQYTTELVQTMVETNLKLKVKTTEIDDIWWHS